MKKYILALLTAAALYSQTIHVNGRLVRLDTHHYKVPTATCNYLEVFRNGLLQDPADDYTVSNCVITDTHGLWTNDDRFRARWIE